MITSEQLPDRPYQTSHDTSPESGEALVIPQGISLSIVETLRRVIGQKYIDSLSYGFGEAPTEVYRAARVNETPSETALAPYRSMSGSELYDKVLQSGDGAALTVLYMNNTRRITDYVEARDKQDLNGYEAEDFAQEHSLLYMIYLAADVAKRTALQSTPYESLRLGLHTAITGQRVRLSAKDAEYIRELDAINQYRLAQGESLLTVAEIKSTILSDHDQMSDYAFTRAHHVVQGWQLTCGAMSWSELTDTQKIAYTMDAQDRPELLTLPQRLVPALQQILSEQEYQVIRDTYGLENNPPGSFSEVAASLSIDTVKVTQLHRNVLRKLRRIMAIDPKTADLYQDFRLSTVL